MNKEKAQQILKDYIEPDGSIFGKGQYICWEVGKSYLTLDSVFEIDELEAIVWWIRNSPHSV